MRNILISPDMSHPLLTRDTHRRSSRPMIPVLPDIQLTTGRVHEFCGPARRMLACLVAGRIDGPVFWIHPAWHPDELYLPTVARFFNPGRLTILRPNRVEDFLWTMEECLRDGSAPLVVGDFHAPADLTPVRRLNLAAEAAMQERMKTTMGLLLSPGDGGSAGVETRWHIAGAHTPGKRAWRLERRRARMEPPKTWELTPGWTLTPRPAATADGAL